MDTDTSSLPSESQPVKDGPGPSEIVLESDSHQKGRAKMLLDLLKRHQEALNVREDLSPCFTGDVLKVAEKCWEQIHSNIGEAIKVKHEKMFEQYGVLQKLSEIDHLEQTQNSSEPAWRPSGIPSEDYDVAAGAEARLSIIPKFEQKYLEAQQFSSELEKVLEEKQQKVKDLEAEIRTRLEQLDTIIDS